MPSSVPAMMFATLERVRKLTVRSGRARATARHTDQMLRRSECRQSSCCTSIQRGTSYIAASRSSSRSEIWLSLSSALRGAQQRAHDAFRAAAGERVDDEEHALARLLGHRARAHVRGHNTRGCRKITWQISGLRNCRRAPDMRELTCTSTGFNHGSRDKTRHPRSMFSKCHQRPRGLRATCAQLRPARMVPHPGSLRYMMAA